MTLPRPVLIALLGLALCGAAFLAVRSANDTGSAVTTSAAPLTQTPATPAKKAATPAKHANGPKAHKATPQKHAAAKPHKATPAPAKPETKPATPAASAPATPAKPAVDPQTAKVLPAIKAYKRGDVVVFFFTHAGPADDTGTRQAVKALGHPKHVSIFKVGLKDLELYRPVLSGAGVSQVPALVVAKSGKKAHLLQGFIDARTLRQAVADARR
jgi:hypothetical protein